MSYNDAEIELHCESFYGAYGNDQEEELRGYHGEKHVCLPVFDTNKYDGDKIMDITRRMSV